MHSTNAGAAAGYPKVVVAASIGTFIELYDLLAYGYFATILAAQFFPRADPTAGLLATFAIFALGFFGRPIGGIIFGHIGDRYGRRTTLAFSLLLMTGATVAFAALPTYSSVGLLAPVLLLVCRLLQGLSVSAEVTGAQLLILEHASSRWRGLAVGINNAAGSLGTAAAATVALVLAQLLTAEQLAAWGWRVAFLLAAPIGLVGVYVRTRLLDSPAFVALGEVARQGRAPLIRILSTAKRRVLVMTIWFGVVSLGGIMLAAFLPSFLIRVARLSPADAYAASLVAIIVQAMSMVAGGYLADRFPLRRVAIGAMACVAVAAVPGYLIITHYRTLGAAIIGQVMWTAFQGATYTLGTIMNVVMFPVGVRFTAGAVAQGLGSVLLGTTSPYVATWLIAATASELAPGVYLLAAALVGLLAAAVGWPSARLRDTEGAGPHHVGPAPAGPSA